MVLSGVEYSVLEGREMLAQRGSIIQRPMEWLAFQEIVGPRGKRKYGKLGMKCCRKGTWSPH